MSPPETHIHAHPPILLGGGGSTLSSRLRRRGRSGTLAARQTGASPPPERSSVAPTLLPVTQPTAATKTLPIPPRCPRHPDSFNSQTVPTPSTAPPRATQESGTFLQPNRLTKPGQACLNPTAVKGTQRAGCGEAARLHGSGARPGHPPPRMLPGRCLGRVAAGGPPRGPHHPRAALLTRCLWVLLPPPAAPAPGRRGEGAPWSAFSPLQRMTLGRETRENPREPWKPCRFPRVLDGEGAGSALPFIPLGRQISQELEKPQAGAKPQRPPAKGLPSRPASQSDEWVCVWGGGGCKCASGRMRVRESPTTTLPPAPGSPPRGRRSPLLGSKKNKLPFVTAGPWDRPISGSTTCSWVPSPPSSHGARGTSPTGPSEVAPTALGKEGYNPSAEKAAGGWEAQARKQQKVSPYPFLLLHSHGRKKKKRRGGGGRRRTKRLSSLTCPGSAHTEELQTRVRREGGSNASRGPQLHNFGVKLWLPQQPRDPSGRD